MVESQLLDKKIRSNVFSQYDDLMFPEGVNEIHLFGYNILSNNKKRRYLIELHHYNGFALLKFYPKILKKNKRKYEIRGVELGFNLSKPEVFQLMYECAKIMRDYLENNQNCFIGYVGQTDKIDNHKNRRRLYSQRSSIYNLMTNSIFVAPKYKLSSGKIFQEVNLRLIRKVKSKQEGKITKEQMENYKLFLNFFRKNHSALYELMTEETRSRYITSD